MYGPRPIRFLRALVSGLFKILRFSGRWYSKCIIPTPFFGSWLHRQNFNCALRQYASLRKQLTFGDATTGFPAKFRLRNKRRNSILMTHHQPYLGSASDWLNQISHEAGPIRSTTQIWVVTCHEYRISAPVSLMAKTVGASPNVGCFLRLQYRQLHRLFGHLFA